MSLNGKEHVAYATNHGGGWISLTPGEYQELPKVLEELSQSEGENIEHDSVTRYPQDVESYNTYIIPSKFAPAVVAALNR